MCLCAFIVVNGICAVVDRVKEDARTNRITVLYFTLLTVNPCASTADGSNTEDYGRQVNGHLNQLNLCVIWSLQQSIYSNPGDDQIGRERTQKQKVAFLLD